MSKNCEQYIYMDKYKNVEEEYLINLYNRYYYIAERYYKQYKGNDFERAKLLAEKMLMEKIKRFALIRDTGDYRGMANYLQNRFRNFESKLNPQPQLNDLEYMARCGNIEARKMILSRYQKGIDKYINNFCDLASKIINEDIINSMNAKDDYSYLDNDFNLDNNFILKDDVIQEFYLFSWELLNNYYDNKNYDTKISTYLFNRLSWFYDIKIEKVKESMKIEYKDDLDYKIYDNQMDFKQIERTEFLDLIEGSLENTLKLVFQKIRLGYSYSEIASILGISRSRAQHVKYKVLEIVKRKGLDKI